MTKWWVAGSREINSQKIHNGVKAVLFERLEIFDEIMTGGARGIDTMVENLLGRTFFAELKLTIHPSLKPDWKKYKKYAGFVRNEEGVDWADKVLVFWDGKSKGSKHVIDYANKHKKVIVVIQLYKIKEETNE